MAVDVQAHIAGRDWILERPADLEALWDGLDEDVPGAEDQIPYWVELWPATRALCLWLQTKASLLQEARCLDIGCGLGLSALLAQSLGAQTTAMDYSLEALLFTRKNAVRNGVAPPFLTCVNWERPAYTPGAFDFIWGADILYETRFFDPLEALMLDCLAPGGRIWLADPERTVSRSVWSKFVNRHWSVSVQARLPVALDSGKTLISLWELRRACVTRDF